MTQDGLSRIMDVLLEGHQLTGWSGARAGRDELERGDGAGCLIATSLQHSLPHSCYSPKPCKAYPPIAEPRS